MPTLFKTFASRHRPVYVQFVVERVSLQNQCYDDDSNIKLACINCSMVTHSQIECFSADVESVCVLGGIAERKLSNTDIGGTYQMLTKTLNDYAHKHFPMKRYAKFLKPYWNEELSNYHKIMTSKSSMWIDAGRPKCGSVYHSYKDAKLSFDGSIGIIRHNICYPLTMILTVWLS